jgi:hypothetical protein
MKVTSSVLPIATTVSIVQAPCHRPLHDLIVDTIVKATQLRLLWLKGFVCLYVLGKSRERYHPCKKQQDHMTTRPGNNKYKKPQSAIRTLRGEKQSDHLNTIELDSMPTQAGFIRATQPTTAPFQPRKVSATARSKKLQNGQLPVRNLITSLKTQGSAHMAFPRGNIDVHTPIPRPASTPRRGPLPRSRILVSHFNFPGQKDQTS